MWWLVALVSLPFWIRELYKKASLWRIRKFGHSIDAGEFDTTKRQVPYWLRWQIAAAQWYCCLICESTLPASGVELDHKVPWALLASSHPRNLQLLCPVCHARKSCSVDLQKIRARV